MRYGTMPAALIFIVMFAGCLSFLPRGAGAETLVLQPGSEGKDSYVTDMFGWSANNYGNIEWFQILGLVDNSAAYIEFDISSIPEGSTINSALVTLWAEYRDGMIYFDPVASAWEELVVTWNNRPGATTPRLSYPITRGDPSGPCYMGCALTFDITAVVQYWLDVSNFGLRIVADTPYLGWMMASSDNLSYPRPMLSISYTEPVAVEANTWGGIKALY